MRTAILNAVRDGARRRHLVPVPAERPDDQSHSDGDHSDAMAARSRLEGLLRALPPRQRATVVLRVVEGLSEAETAAALDCSVGTVKSNLARGLGKVRTVLATGRTQGQGEDESMNDDLLLVSDDDVAVELRTLAAAAAPTLRARPDLARRVLDRTPTQSGHSRARRAGIVAGAGLLMVAAAAVSRPGSGSHFSIIEPSAAMTPTVAVGEQVTFSKRLDPQQGDVVYARITAPGFGHHTISRVVAVAGDTVACPADPAGDCTTLVVNGRPVPEPYLGGMAIAPFASVHVPPAALFLMGDARASAADSRIYGLVRTDQVSGVAVRITGDGRSRPVPGAPSHPAPHGGVDPADLPPRAPAAEAS